MRETDSFRLYVFDCNLHIHRPGHALARRGIVRYPRHEFALDCVSAGRPRRCSSTAPTFEQHVNR